MDHSTSMSTHLEHHQRLHMFFDRWTIAGHPLRSYHGEGTMDRRCEHTIV
jgi:hypothetical protein